MEDRPFRTSILCYFAHRTVTILLINEPGLFKGVLLEIANNQHRESNTAIASTLSFATQCPAALAEKASKINTKIAT